MLRVGLTGGIGAGKSTVSAALQRCGAVIIDADVLAREVVEPGSDGLVDVVRRFGEDVLTPDGALDRSRLSAVVFDDAAARADLNAIIHPRVEERRTELVARTPDDAVVVEDIPLLVEVGLAPSYPFVVVVHTEVEERIRRLTSARDMTEPQARARVEAQIDDETRLAAADVILDNTGAPEVVSGAAERLYQERLAPMEANLRTGSPPPRDGPRLTESDPAWAAQAARLVQRLSAAAGESALRVDHIGSTSVPGLAAKDVLDVQIVVADLDVARAVASDLRAVGLVERAGEWWDNALDGTRLAKRFAVETDPGRAVNCHIRPERSPAWREALLLRDWLRTQPEHAAEYEKLKHRLAAAHDDVELYAEGKTSFIRTSLARAETWATATGWQADVVGDATYR